MSISCLDQVTFRIRERQPAAFRNKQQFVRCCLVVGGRGRVQEGMI
jgi:hypothetical protein